MQTYPLPNSEESADTNTSSLPGQSPLLRHPGRAVMTKPWTDRSKACPASTRAVIASPPEVAGQRGRNGILFSVECSSRTGLAHRLRRRGIVSFFCGNALWDVSRCFRASTKDMQSEITAKLTACDRSTVVSKFIAFLVRARCCAGALHDQACWIRYRARCLDGDCRHSSNEQEYVTGGGRKDASMNPV